MVATSRADGAVEYLLVRLIQLKVPTAFVGVGGTAALGNGDTLGLPAAGDDVTTSDARTIKARMMSTTTLDETRTLVAPVPCDTIA
jgi:hypothetical protein